MVMQIKRLLNLTGGLSGDRVYSLPLLVLYLTDGCNSRCVTCDIWRSPRRNMTMELVEQIVGGVDALGISQVLFSGGEAMQHPEWPEIARRFRQAGVRVMLLTNGLLLRKQVADVIATVDEVIVSLDGGTAETYQAIRGVDAFDLVLDGIRAARAGGLPVTTRTTVQRANYRELGQIIAAGLASDVNTISFLAVDVSNEFAFGPRFQADGSIPLVAGNGAGAMPNHGPGATALSAEDVDTLSEVLDEVEMRYAAAFASGRIAESPEKLRRILVDYFGALNGRGEFPGPACNAPHFSAVVGVDGTVQPCYFLPEMGKMNGDGLRGVLNSGAARALRRAYRQGERSECDRCVCPLYRGPRGLMKL